jgi:hypothetical protein
MLRCTIIRVRATQTGHGCNYFDPRLAHNAFKYEQLRSIAKISTDVAYFALARRMGFAHKDQAFQASSPKTFQGPVGNNRASLFVPVMAGEANGGLHSVLPLPSFC